MGIEYIMLIIAGIKRTGLDLRFNTPLEGGGGGGHHECCCVRGTFISQGNISFPTNSYPLTHLNLTISLYSVLVNHT